MPVTVCSRAGTSLLYTRPRSLARVLLDPAGPPNRQRVFASLSLSPSLSLSVAQPAPSLPPPRRSLARSPLPSRLARPPRSTDTPILLFTSRLSFSFRLLASSLPIRAVALANRGKLKRASEHCFLQPSLYSTLLLLWGGKEGRGEGKRRRRERRPGIEFLLVDWQRRVTRTVAILLRFLAVSHSHPSLSHCTPAILRGEGEGRGALVFNLETGDCFFFFLRFRLFMNSRSRRNLS